MTLTAWPSSPAARDLIAAVVTAITGEPIEVAA
jgi:hypothetical protein